MIVENEQKYELERLDKKEFSISEQNILNELSKNALLYFSAMREVQTKIEILREDFRQTAIYNPIEHIKSRVKQPSSILKKVYLRGIPLDAEVIQNSLNDMVGVRVVCTFKEDIYKIAEILQNMTDFEVLTIKDYIKNPKISGYQSYHLIINVPVDLVAGRFQCKVEIQLRTMAMDFWATLEHKIKYKFNWTVPEEIKQELHDCSQVVDLLDDKMLTLHKKVHLLKADN